ncbi:hypothetical protein M441DRAFT_49380 [Trichoderma asperellum CBS 433.97]|uniref:Uncharacterized protein n=1 Tax=Trichoderma asperellum (strain ATCC 204424 / CBS 433.97 / NBRC 101777) TaxID=1042311 RepID=A0A2T3Z2R0_TRIA4|nr:hypothetical protein M441DRAFT_49380 [Trichoderma asperellum CBS 433.97]PTB39030.1 hypothetical protein M441DRAFT_49380 [Trichoderma asperellum CBS 433.97]
MHTHFLLALGLVAGSPLVRADMDGGYLKSMFKSRLPVPTSSEFIDSRFYSLWSSFHKIYLEHLASATMSSSVAATTVVVTTTIEPTEPVFTIGPGSLVPTAFSASGPIETVSFSTTVTQSVSSCNSTCPSITAPPVLPETTRAVQPSKNGTAATSTGGVEPAPAPRSTSSKSRPFPSKTPPPLNGPLNGAPTNAAPAVGTIIVAIAGYLMML